MGLKVNTDRVLTWDNEIKNLVPRIKISVSIVTNKGTVIGDSDSIYIRNMSEYHEVVDTLTLKCINNLSSESVL
jgi:hypothetical protein